MNNWHMNNKIIDNKTDKSMLILPYTAINYNRISYITAFLQKFLAHKQKFAFMITVKPKSGVNHKRPWSLRWKGV